MLKKVLLVILVLALIAGGAIYYVLGNLDTLVKQAIEETGTETLGTKVFVGGVRIHLTDGKATIHSLEVQNPPGFSQKPMLSLQDLMARISYSEGLVIDEVIINRPHILFEQKGTESNFQRVLDHMNAQGSSKDSKETTSKSDEEETEYRIDRLEIRDAKVTVITDASQKPKEAVLKEMTFENLQGTEGQIALQMMTQISKRLIKEFAVQAIQGEIQKRLDNGLGESVKGVKEQGKKLLEGLKQ